MCNMCGEMASKSPEIGVLYDLLSDMVHPNIGSGLCIIVPNSDNSINFEARSPKSAGLNLFKVSFPAFGTLVGGESAKMTQVLMHLFVPLDDPIAQN